MLVQQEKCGMVGRPVLLPWVSCHMSLKTMLIKVSGHLFLQNCIFFALDIPLDNIGYLQCSAYLGYISSEFEI